MSHTPGEHDEPAGTTGHDAGGAVPPSRPTEGAERPERTSPAGGANRIGEGRSKNRLPAVVAAVVTLALLAGLLLWHPWSRHKQNNSSTSGESASPSSPSATSASQSEVLANPSRMFAAGNVYAQDITGAPLDSKSPAMVANLTAQVRKYYSGHPSLNYDRYNGTLWKADSSTPKTTVKYVNCQHKKKGDWAGLLDGPKYFVNIPIPANAQSAKGTDGQLAVWSPGEDKLWELWQAKKTAKGTWEACWGGRIDNVSKSIGQMPYGFGSSASGLAVSGSMISVDEAKKLDIKHAMGLNIPDPAKWPNWSYPANRTDGGSSDASALPEGARLRLDPSVDVDSLKITPLAKAIAKAAQTYGFIVTDKAGSVAVVTEGGQRRMVNAKGKKVAADPWKAILGKSQGYTVLDGFPWDKLQVVTKDWGKPASASSSSGSN